MPQAEAAADEIEIDIDECYLSEIDGPSKPADIVELSECDSTPSTIKDLFPNPPTKTAPSAEKLVEVDLFARKPTSRGKHPSNYRTLKSGKRVELPHKVRTSVAAKKNALVAPTKTLREVVEKVKGAANKPSSTAFVPSEEEKRFAVKSKEAPEPHAPVVSHQPCVNEPHAPAVSHQPFVNKPRASAPSHQPFVNKPRASVPSHQPVARQQRVSVSRQQTLVNEPPALVASAPALTATVAKPSTKYVIPRRPPPQPQQTTTKTPTYEQLLVLHQKKIDKTRRKNRNRRLRNKRDRNLLNHLLSQQQ